MLKLPENLGQLLQDAIRGDRMLITPIVRMEILYSARTSTEFVALESELDALRILRNDRAVTDAAAAAIRELAHRNDGYHRVPPTDALIAAAAAEHGGLAVLHRDGHFDRRRPGAGVPERRASRTVGGPFESSPQRGRQHRGRHRSITHAARAR